MDVLLHCKREYDAGLSAIGACGIFADDEEAFSTDGRERLENSEQMRRLGASHKESGERTLSPSCRQA